MFKGVLELYQWWLLRADDPSVIFLNHRGQLIRYTAFLNSKSKVNLFVTLLLNGVFFVSVDINIDDSSLGG